MKPHVSCATIGCENHNEQAPMDMLIAVGFGSAYASCDGEIIYDEIDGAKTVADIEALAKSNPKHDWRICMYGPRRSVVFQRQGEKKWLCLKSNKGFA